MTEKAKKLSAKEAKQREAELTEALFSHATNPTAPDPKTHWWRFQMGHPKVGGRVKGTPNKLTKSVADALKAAYAGIGGEEALTEFARDNPAEFFKLWVKMMPTKVEAELNLSGAMVDVLQEGRKRVAAAKPKSKRS